MVAVRDAVGFPEISVDLVQPLNCLRGPGREAVLALWSVSIHNEASPAVQPAFFASLEPMHGQVDFPMCLEMSSSGAIVLVLLDQV